MIDLDISNRDLFGNVTFLMKSGSVTGIEKLIQKVVILVLSNIQTTFFNSIPGSDAMNASKYNFNADGSSDFKLAIADNLINIIKFIKADEVTYNIPVVERLQDIQIKDVVFDNSSLSVFLSLIIVTNSATVIIQLPVKK